MRDIGAPDTAFDKPLYLIGMPEGEYSLPKYKCRKDGGLFPAQI